MTLTRPRAVLITGASSGIGAALAEAYAGPETCLFLSGRESDRIDSVAETCRSAGAVVDARSLDVRDAAAMAAWIDGSEAVAPLDLVIANAGVSDATSGRGEGDDPTRTMFAINLDGMLNTVLPAIPAMRSRQRGQIALMASLGGYAGLPGAAAYNGSKAAVKVWGEGLRGDLAPDGIGVSVICPGWVDSRITRANRFPMPFFMDAPRAAEIIKRGLERNRARIAFPWPTAFAAWLLMTLPAGLTDRIVRRLPRKG